MKQKRAVMLAFLGVAVALASDAPQAALGVQGDLEPTVSAGSAGRAALAGLRQNWLDGYVRRGGDRNVVVGLGWARGVSERFTRATGQARFDLIRGTVAVSVQGLERPADVWLLDNLPGAGKSTLAERGDRLMRLGRIETSGPGTLTAALGTGYFKGFELDWVILTDAGKSPIEGGVLFGTRPSFERRFTRERLAAERANSGDIETAAYAPGTLSGHSASTDLLVSSGLVSADVAEGAELFFRGTFSGNGRTCASCHRAENNQGLDLDFIGTLPAHDKLFVAEQPVSTGGVPGLERPLLMRGHALILENVDGLENPTGKFTARGVPISLSQATSIRAPNDGRAPAQRTGWSGDGAPSPGTLRLFPLGATIQHFTKSLARIPGADFVAPTDDELDAMEAFMLSSGRLNELTLANVTLSDAGAQAGKVRFVAADSRCNTCHANAGANVGNGQNRNFDTGVERSPDPSQITEPHPLDGGFGVAARDCDGNGSNDCFGDGTFNSTPLIEAADTEPFFHNNSAATIEDAIAFYATPAFANSGSGGGNAIPLSLADIENLGKFLRVINAAFNTGISIQRNEAALVLLDQWIAICGDNESLSCANGTQVMSTVEHLLELSSIEGNDARQVLEDKGLHSDATKDLKKAIHSNHSAISVQKARQKRKFIERALEEFQSAKASYGNGLNFTLGEGNLLF